MEGTREEQALRWQRPQMCSCVQRELASLIKANTFQLPVAASRHTQLSDKPEENCVGLLKHRVSPMSAQAQRVGWVKPRSKRRRKKRKRKRRRKGYEASPMGNSHL